MIPIKIHVKNKAAIEAALFAVNGQSTIHMFTKFDELQELAARTEKLLFDFLGDMTRAPGAACVATSGLAIARAASRARRAATRVTLERFATAWYLTEIDATEIDEEGGGKPGIHVTDEQLQRG